VIAVEEVATAVVVVVGAAAVVDAADSIYVKKALDDRIEE